MATIVEGINKLITAAGGTPTGNAGTIAEKLDQLEDVFGGGSGGSVMIVNEDSETGALDKTFREIEEAFMSGTKVIVCYISHDSDNDKDYTCFDEVTRMLSDDINNNAYAVSAGSRLYLCSDKDEYPVLD